MKIKKEYVILVVIIISLSLYLILRNPNRVLYDLPTLPELFSANISRIEISNQGSSITLNMKDNNWVVTHQAYPASFEKIKKMLEIIEAFPIIALVSESKNYKPFDLDGSKKITVKAWSGDTVGREFEIGKTTRSYQHTFVKLAGDYRVYQIKGNIRAIFNQTVDTLRDKVVLSYDPNTIQEIHAVKGKNSLTIIRKEIPVEPTDQEAGVQTPDTPITETVWLTADGREIDKLLVKSLIDRLANLYCQGYIEGRKKEDFKNPKYSLRLKGEREYTLSIFEKTDKDAKKQPAISSGNDYPFLFNPWLATKITENLDAFFNEPDKT